MLDVIPQKQLLSEFLDKPDIVTETPYLVSIFTLQLHLLEINKT